MTAAASAANTQRITTALSRADFRTRLIKIVSGIAIGICFWFSVPYEMPFIVLHMPSAAAALEAVRYEGSKGREISLPLLALLCIFLLWRLPQRGRIGGPVVGLVCLYVGWALLSVTWSEDPATTVKRLLVFSIDVFFAYTAARIYSVVEIALLGFVATFSVVLCALYSQIITLKEFMPSDPDFRFMGVMSPNYQAMNLIASMFCGLMLLDRKPQWLRWIIFAVPGEFALLYLTRSRLGMMVFLILFMVILKRILEKALRPQMRAMAIVAVLAVGLPGFIYFAGRNGTAGAQEIFMMGRKDTENTSNLSNRAPLWAELMESVEKRPIGGVGYAGFWTSQRVMIISADQGWPVPHAHDSYLDQALSVGVVGAVFYAAMLWVALYLACKRYSRNKTGTNLFPAIMLGWITLEGIAENAPLDPFLPTMIAYICLAKLCLVEGSEAESDVWLKPGELIGGLTPVSFEKLPPETRDEMIAAMENVR